MTDTFTYHYARDCWSCDALELARRAAAELKALGWGDPVVDESLQFIWAEDTDRLPVAILAHSYDAIEDEIWIELSYVEERFRGRHIYSDMYERLFEVAVRKQAFKITSEIHEKNCRMLTIAQAKGRELTRSKGYPFVRATHRL